MPGWNPDLRSANPQFPPLSYHGVESRGVVEDDAQREAPAFVQRADTVAHGGAIVTALAAHWPVMDREDHRFAPAQ